MNGRLAFAIVSTLIEEAVVAVLLLWGLPRMGIRMPTWGVGLVMAAWLVYSVVTYRVGSRALSRETLAGQESMVGMAGETAAPLTPEGMVRIKGELWTARSESGEIPAGEKVVVVAQQRLVLVVRPADRR